MRRTLVIAIATLVALAFAAPAFAASTAVKGHQKDKYDQDGNGFTDAGVYVTGHYTSYYAEDGNGDYYWDLGDGRVYKTVDSVDDLDQATLDECFYTNNYRADFGNDPFMDHGWIMNNILCKGYSGTNHYKYLIVSDTDPRYSGNPDWAVWGTWEYHVLAQTGFGNLVRPYKPTG
jgi:hypothetical protein